ncbi:MAG: anti-sigma factor family protein [Candidatus Saccharicenans sp.]
MSCLRPGEIYDYLEKEMAGDQRAKVEEHLKSCSRCQEALLRRQALLEGLNRLPRLEPPQEFARQVMSGLPELSPKKIWVVAAAGGLYLLFNLTIVFWVLATRLKVMSWTWEILKHIFTLALDISRLIFLGFKYLQALVKSFSLSGKVIINFLANLLPPAVTLALFLLGIFLSIAMAFCLIKNLKLSERS